MLVGLLALLYFDYKIEVWTGPSATYHGFVAGPGGRFGLSGVGVLILMMALLPLAMPELANLFTAEKV